MRREQYISGLKDEKASLEQRPQSDTRDRRLAEVDDQLDQYGEKPQGRRREKRSTEPTPPPPPAPLIDPAPAD
ncbi:hypothetical protein ACSMXN_09280 [Jatrophihabitans sp. DSM 45814]